MGCVQSNNNGSCLFRSIYNCKRNLETLQKGLPSRTTWPRIYLPFRSWEPALLKLMVRVSSSSWNRCRLSFLFVVPARCAHFAYVSYDSPTLNVLYLLFSILFFLLFCFFFFFLFSFSTNVCLESIHRIFEHALSLDFIKQDCVWCGDRRLLSGNRINYARIMRW